MDLQVKMRRTTPRQPVILNRAELMGTIDKLEERYKTPALLQYGAGLRLKELVGVRLKDVDLQRGVLTIRAGKNDKDRETVIPNCLKEALSKKIDESLRYWEEDRRLGVAGVALPGALARKMSRSGEKPGWHWLFCAEELSKDPESGVIRRHHMHPKVYAEAISRAAEKAGIRKRVTTHALRHAFATDLIRGGTDIRTLQELLGHADVKTAEIYAHAAVIRQTNDLQMVSCLKEVRQVLQKAPKTPLHFVDLKHEQRVPYVRRVSVSMAAVWFRLWRAPCGMPRRRRPSACPRPRFQRVPPAPCRATPARYGTLLHASTAEL